MLKEHRNMPEKKNFLLLAIMMGAAGIIIGGFTIWNMALDLFKP